MSTPSRAPAPGQAHGGTALSPGGTAPRTPPPLFGNRPIGGLGIPTQKAKDFKGTLARLSGYLRPHRNALIVVIVAGALGTVFSVVGPKLLGLATTKIYEGALARSQGTPGAGIDFTYIRRLLTSLIGLYVVSNVFTYLMQYLMAGIAQKTVYALR